MKGAEGGIVIQGSESAVAGACFGSTVRKPARDCAQRGGYSVAEPEAKERVCDHR